MVISHRAAATCPVAQCRSFSCPATREWLLSAIRYSALTRCASRQPRCVHLSRYCCAHGWPSLSSHLTCACSPAFQILVEVAGSTHAVQYRLEAATQVTVSTENGQMREHVVHFSGRTTAVPSGDSQGTSGVANVTAPGTVSVRHSRRCGTAADGYYAGSWAPPPQADRPRPPRLDRFVRKVTSLACLQKRRS